jgi:transcriptional regulator with XRE-family HTH domain
MPSLSEILISKIGKHGKSKAYVASQLGVSEKTIENYMNGKRNPQPKAIIKLASILSFNLNDLSEQNVPPEKGAKNGSTNDFSDIDMTTMTMKPTFGKKEEQPVIF